jgi:ArsR family transcriptional regulator, cadmium/lead-responsive transcriptional repressor
MLTAETYSLALKAKLFRGFSDPSRLSILESLRAGPMTVGEVVLATGRAQSSVSTHLACLYECGLVSREQRGKFVYYRISDERVDEILRLGDSLLADVAKGVYECTRYDEPEEGA